MDNVNSRKTPKTLKSEKRIGGVLVSELMVAGFVLLLLEFVVLLNFMILPFKRQGDEVHKILSQYRTMQQQIQQNIENAEERGQLLQKLEGDIAVLEAAIPPAMHNEDLALSIGALAEKHNITIEALTFEGRELVSQEEYLRRGGLYDAAGQSQVSAEGLADSASGLVQEGALGSVGVLGELDANLGMSGRALREISVQGVQIHFSSEFHTFGEFIGEVESGERKILVKSISVARVQEGVLRGTINLEYAALSGSPEQEQSGQFRAPAHEPKDSVFQRYEGYVEEGTDPTILLISSDEDIDPNFYLILNSSVSNDTKVTYGVFPRTDTELYFNANNAVPAKLSISGDEERFEYTWSLGVGTKSERRRLEVVDGKLRIDIISHPRYDDKDKVALLLEVENKTTIPVEIRVKNDDVLNPRFNLGKTVGEVALK